MMSTRELSGEPGQAPKRSPSAKVRARMQEALGGPRFDDIFLVEMSGGL